MIEEKSLSLKIKYKVLSGFSKNIFVGRAIFPLIIVSLNFLKINNVLAGNLEVEKYSANIYVESLDKVKFSFEFWFPSERKFPVKEIKLLKEEAYYLWNKDSFLCFAEGIRKIPFQRVPRADGFTALKIKAKRIPFQGEFSCRMEGSIDINSISSVWMKNESGYVLSILLPAMSSMVREMIVTVHFPVGITGNDVSPDDLTSEEFTVSYLPSSISLSALSVPPNHSNLLSLRVSESLLKLDENENSDFTRESLLGYVNSSSIERLNPLKIVLLVIVATILNLIFILIRNRSTEGRNLILPGLGFARVFLSICFATIQLVLSLASYLQGAIIFMFSILILNLKTNQGDCRIDIFKLDKSWGIVFLILYILIGTLPVIFLWKFSIRVSLSIASMFLLSSIFLFSIKSRQL